MKTIPLLLALAMAAALSGCASVDRSRALNDPRIPPTATAQQVCSNCHGVDGNSVSPNFPRLAGQPADYLVSQLKQFRSHDRADPAGFVYMWGLSRHLSDGQIEGLARYFASQPALPNARGDPDPAGPGRAIFEKGIASAGVPPCSSCHGADGHGAGVFPRLAGQHADYVVKQLAIFKNTEQRPGGAMMKGVTHSLTTQNMKAVAAYLQGMS